MKKQRLDKFVSQQKGISRSDSRTAVKRGRVAVNGAVVRDFGHAISPIEDTITFDGQNITYKKHLYIMMNKPSGVLSAANDKSRQTVVGLVPPELYRNGLFPVGRLDRDTTGLLLITDDGDFAHRVISPKSGISKSYIAELDGDVTPDMILKFREGVTLVDGTVCRPAILERIGQNKARLILYEGKYHEVKRMFGTVGLGVNALHREAIGELYLPEDLGIGKCVEMNENSLKKVEKCIPYPF